MRIEERLIYMQGITMPY